MSRVGIVILNYNTCRQTLRLIQSIHEHYVVYDKIVIVDNCSMMESLDILTPICNDKIKIIKNKKKLWLCKGE